MSFCKIFIYSSARWRFHGHIFNFMKSQEFWWTKLKLTDRRHTLKPAVHLECQISKHSSSNCLNTALNKTQPQSHRVLWQKIRLSDKFIFWHYLDWYYLKGSPNNMIRMVVEHVCTLTYWLRDKSLICIIFMMDLCNICTILMISDVWFA